MGLSFPQSRKEHIDNQNCASELRAAFAVFIEGQAFELAAPVFAMKKIFVNCVRLILVAMLMLNSHVPVERLALVDDQLPRDSGLHKPGLLAKAATSPARVFADLQSRDSVTGQNRMYLMNGNSITASSHAEWESNVDWQVVNTN